jgi:lysophospholipase L1-like esterase
VFAALLAERFAGGSPAIEIVNAGVGGNNTDQAGERFDRDVLGRHPDVVTLFFGINDSAVDVQLGARSPRVGVDRYKANLLRFVRTLKARGVAAVLLTPNPVAWTPELRKLYAGPPYKPDEPDGWNVLLKDYAAAVREVAAEQRVALVDVDRLFRDAASVPGRRLHDLLSDGMHPNDRGHDLIAEQVAQAVENALAAE